MVLIPVYVVVVEMVTLVYVIEFPVFEGVCHACVVVCIVYVGVCCASLVAFHAYLMVKCASLGATDAQRGMCYVSEWVFHVCVEVLDVDGKGRETFLHGFVIQMIGGSVMLFCERLTIVPDHFCLYQTCLRGDKCLSMNPASPQFSYLRVCFL